VNFKRTNCYKKSFLQTTSRMISQLLIEMDALKAIVDDETSHEGGDAIASRVFVLAATNALAAIDPAFLQPGTHPFLS
jgi:SpoVK/Ycf46/Vps4 family AAA+-type ATPase